MYKVMSERSVQFSEPKNHNVFKRCATPVVVTLGSLSAVMANTEFGMTEANAAPQYFANGTGQGRPGPHVMPPSDDERFVYTRAATAVVDPTFPESAHSTADNYEREILAGPDDSEAVGYSSSALSLHEAIAENPDVAFKLSQVTYIGDPCNEGQGILILSAEARALVGDAQCKGPHPNPGLHETQIYSNEDPIANFHYPISLVDLANMLGGYFVDHRYQSDPATYDVTQHEEGNRTEIVIDHHNSAFRRWMLESYGIDITDQGEMLVQQSIYHDAPAPGAQAVDEPLPIHQASAEISEPAPVAPDPVVEIQETIGQAQEDWNVYVESTEEQINTAVADATDQFNQVIQGAQEQITEAVNNGTQNATLFINQFLPQPPQ